MQDFKRGDKVRITIDAEVAHTSGDLLSYTYPLREGVDFKSVGLSSTVVTVELIASAEWPPQVGDLWRDREGDLWLATRSYDDVRMVCSNGGGETTCRPGELGMYGPLTLVYREEASES